MSKLNDFINSSVDFLSNDIFNISYWGIYYLTFCVGLVFALIPPFTVLGVALLVTPVLAYGLAWAVVGIAKLVDLLDKKLSGFSELKDSNDDDAIIISEPVAVQPVISAQPSLDAVLNASAYSNPREGIVEVLGDDTENSLQV